MSISRSVSFAPSIRVEAPTDSTVAIRRNVARRSGARLPRAFHAPLNSSISPTSRSNSGVSTRFLKGSNGIPERIPENTQAWGRVFSGILSGNLVGAVYDRPQFGDLRDRGRSQTAPTGKRWLLSANSVDFEDSKERQCSREPFLSA